MSGSGLIRAFRSFVGGIHPTYGKDLAAAAPIRELPLPERVVIPLSQHIGVPAEVAVKVGDMVAVGQVLGTAKGPVSAPVHASISGTVTAIGAFPHPSGRQVISVVIEGDGKDTWFTGLADGVTARLATSATEDFNGVALHDLDADTVRERIVTAGVVGLGGATFPTGVKLNPSQSEGRGRAMDTLVINGVECEPYLTADHRLMVEMAEAVLTGVQIIARVLGVERVWIGIEDNKPDAIERMGAVLESQVSTFPCEVGIGVLPTKYPQGGEKQLIAVLTGREVPSGGLPLDVGVVVHNVGTAAAVAAAVLQGRPLIERVVTVTGEGVAEPGNAWVRLGTPAEAVLAAFGGVRGGDLSDAGRVVFGGPMMGIAQHDLTVPVIKGTSGILVIPPESLEPDAVIRPCIRCSACIEVCPIGLLPNMISVCAERLAFGESERYHPFDCIECGCCSYVCPSYRPLVQMIRYAKAEVRASKQKAGH